MGLSALFVALVTGCSTPDQTAGDSLGTDQGQAARSQEDASKTRKIQIFEQTLTNPSTDLDTATRQAAATELLALDDPQAYESLIQAVQSGRTVEINAVVAALAAETEPALELRTALLGSLDSAPETTWPAIGRLLARYDQMNPGTLEQIKSIALDQAADTNQRRAAITTLGHFQSNTATAASALIDVLEQSETPAVTIAASDSLSSLTGLPVKKSTEAWLTWWKDNRSKPASQWLKDTIEAQGRRIALLETELQHSQESNELVVDRLVSVFRDLWPLLQVDQQLERIPALLEDDQPELRALSVERIGVLLRDGQGNEAIEHAVVQRLGDPDVTIRRQVAALLTELSNPSVIDTVTGRIDFETDPEVLVAALRFLQTRGDRNSIVKLLPLLNRSETQEAAAATIWSLLQNSDMTREEQLALAEVILPDLSAEASPSLTALWLLSRQEIPDQLATSLLTSAEKDKRTAVAMAMLQRGRGDMLLRYGNDPAIFPLALQAATRIESRRSLDPIDRILMLPPPQPELEQIWTDAIIKASEQLPVSEVVSLDQRLEQESIIDKSIRIAILNRAIAMDELSMAMQISFLKRLVPLLLETKQPVTAVALLDGIPDEQLDEQLIDLRFRSALRARVFDTAASVNNKPEDWISFFETIRDTNPEDSEKLKDEIVTRFRPMLTEEMRTRLGVATDPQMPEADASANASDEAEDGRNR
ncbi:MAG: HEAT repeat domain-containing protein [Phycisphaerales bacterium]|nr:HEAT repeat domain-containing protein [Phycisphaerales bacterium]